MAKVNKSSLSYQTLAQLKAIGRKTTAGEILVTLQEANPNREVALTSIGSFLNKFELYKVAKKTRDGNRTLYEYAGKAGRGDVDAAYVIYLDNVRKGVRTTPKRERRKRSSKVLAEPQGMTEARQTAATTKERPKQVRRKRAAKAVAESPSMREAQQIAAAVTKEIMAAVDKIVAEKMAEIDERMSKLDEVMRALVIKQHGLTDAELTLLKS